jgi:hypothetical protein
MLPVILGAVALGTVGYGIKKCLEDEVECRCKITDWLIDGYDKFEEFERDTINKLSDAEKRMGAKEEDIVRYDVSDFEKLIGALKKLKQET